MRTGILILGQHSSSEGERRVAEGCRSFLESRGRRNVRIGYHRGDPDSYHVMLEMYRSDGVDTFVILPLAIAEGNQTIWSMPKQLTLPDNSGSWTIIDGHDVATRFATALGRNPRMADALIESLGTPENGTGILLLAYGSKLSQSEKTAEYYAGYLEEEGWTVSIGFTRHGPNDVGSAARTLVSGGIGKIRVVPLFIAFDGASANSARATLEGLDVGISYEPPMGDLPMFLEILDSKVPEGW